MPAFAITDTSGQLDVGDTWLLGVEVRLDDLDAEDGAGELVDANLAVLVVRPDTTTATPPAVRDSVGRYAASYPLAAAGRHTAVVTVSGAVASVVTFAVDAAAPGGPPTLPAVKTYLGDSVSSWSDGEMQNALDAEIVNQAKVCRIGATYPADLVEALKRRVARNLAMRALALGTQTQMTDGAIATTRIGADLEIERLEGPYRKFVFA